MLGARMAGMNSGTGLGEFGDAAVPVLGTMAYRRGRSGELIEVNPVGERSGRSPRICWAESVLARMREKW